MKKLILAAALCTIASFPALAQIDMKCRLQNGRTVLFEPVVVSLDIINNTGELLDFSGAIPNAHLAFDIRTEPRRPGSSHGDSFVWPGSHNQARRHLLREGESADSI